MNRLAIRNINRTNVKITGEFAALGTATVHEAQGRTGLLNRDLRPLWRGAAISGPAVTALCHPGDNWMIHVAIEMIQPGDVLVVGLASPNTDGLFGDLLATSLMARGCAGLILDAGCRDISTLEQMKFPVWSRAISAQGTVKETVHSVNLPILCGGQQIVPGDAVVADDDGVVVVPRAHGEIVLQKARARAAEEEVKRKQFEAGAASLDIYGMRDRLDQRGLEYVEGPIDDYAAFLEGRKNSGST
jgi:4-hydroxy-4-methyl-2-oxoglutarate aldolase